MIWKLIPKQNSVQPKNGTYTDWKSILAKEGFNQCVYCAIHDSDFGGIRNFHVEHFKPKSIFKNLVNNIKNLFYSCPICNTFKGNEWHKPSIPDDFKKIYYPDPSIIDYNSLFDINPNTGIIKGKYPISKFLTQKLGLNRNQLILERRTRFLLKEYEKLVAEYSDNKKKLFSLVRNGNIEALDYLEKLSNEMDRLNKLALYVYKSSPYTHKDTKK